MQLHSNTSSLSRFHLDPPQSGIINKRGKHLLRSCRDLEVVRPSYSCSNLVDLSRIEFMWSLLHRTSLPQNITNFTHLKALAFFFPSGTRSTESIVQLSDPNGDIWSSSPDEDMEFVPVEYLPNTGVSFLYTLCG